MEVRFPNGRHQALLLRLKSLNPRRKKGGKEKGGREMREIRKGGKGENKAGRTIT